MYSRVLFIGSKESGLKVLKKINSITPQIIVGCVTVDDHLDSRSKLYEFKEYCIQRQIGIKILEGRCDLSNSINFFKPDLCIVMGWYYIIQQELIEKVKGGFIGIHNSLLPLHRGFSPVVWCLIAGEKETGFSVFSFNKDMDSGDIWYQEKIEILETDYISDVLCKIDDGIERFFDEQYMKIITEKIKPKKQNLERISYGARRTAGDGKIDWNKNAYEIYNFIRAQSKPYPGAYTSYKNEKVIIWKPKFSHI